MDIHDELLLRRRVERTASLLDDRFTIPGTSIRFGWDAILGLIPGVGDAIALVFHFSIMNEAVKARVPFRLLFKMGVNIGIDLAVGAVPLLGDLGDVAWRANRKNAALLLAYLEDPTGTPLRSRFELAAGAVILTLLFSVPAILVGKLIIWLVRTLTA